MQVLILAGGFATRLWPLTEKRAKPLLLLNGKPLISHIVERIPQKTKIAISTNQIFKTDFEKWRENFTDREIDIFIEDSENDDVKKGALGATALFIQEKKLQDDLVLIAGDNYFDFNFEDFLKTFDNNPLIAVFDIKSKKAARKFGVVNLNHQNRVESFEEKPLEPNSSLVSTGLYIFPQKNLNDIIFYAKEKNDDLGGIFEYFLNQKKQTIDCFSFDQGWYDIGSFSAYIDAHQTLQKNQKIKTKSVQIDADSKLEGAVYLGENVQILNSFLKNTIVLANSKIQDCVIRESVIDQNSELYNIDLTQKMIRANSKIIN